MDVRGLWAAVALVAGWGFIGVGLFVWSKNPGNRVGSLMAATGFAWFFSLLGFSNLAAFFTLGAVFGSVYLAVAVHMLLAAPTGRVERRGDRNLVAFAYVLTTVLIVPLYFFADSNEDFDCAECPENLLRIWDNQTILDVLSLAVNLAGAAVVIAALVSLVRRWRSATGPEQQLYGPLYAAGAILMIALALTVTYQTVAWDSSTSEIVQVVLLAPFAVVPYVFLFAFVRARMLQGGAVGELIARVGAAPMPGELRDALAEALDDPSLELVYWLPEDKRFVDGEGRRYEPPEEGARRAVFKVGRDGECIAAIVYDASLRDAQDHVRAVGAAAALVLANERLDAQLRAKVGELRQSRERMLEIGLEERRRLERDLHDGAQQRLVSMALNMRLARARLRDDPGAAERLLDSAGTELEAALEELRELARGIHPAVLSDRGLGTALETLAVRAPFPVELAELPDERLPEAVELAAYFVVSEALANVAKYADASRATVHVGRENGRVVIAVEDDGVGGADPEHGTGLRGLADRLAVLEGRLEVDSPAGRGTTIRARIPCG
jgi:signal transduction histidine kinase